jgi:phenylalanyl-tRNA synthetase alpha chain
MSLPLNDLRNQFEQELRTTQSLTDLENIKIKLLGKKGVITDLMKQLKDCSSEERPIRGKEVNDLKEWIVAQCDQKTMTFIAIEDSQKLSQESIDITLPGKNRYLGRPHPLTQTLNEIIQILIGMGFSVQYGPEIESDYYNFEALNFPQDHPARDMQDTFYIAPHLLLRTHTSNTQTRIMESHRPPLRIIAPGKVYRNETVSVRSHVFFHQVEGLYIDKHVTFADLFATFQEFLNKLFNKEVGVRYRPSYFPFVEPGLEIDVSCLSCSGKGCPICKHSGWLEIAGAGMMHPEVLINGGIDPEEYSGYAWGMGLERLVMVMNGIKDIRLFTENDVRFLNQFSPELTSC